MTMKCNLIYIGEKTQMHYGKIHEFMEGDNKIISCT